VLPQQRLARRCQRPAHLTFDFLADSRGDSIPITPRAGFDVGRRLRGVLECNPQLDCDGRWFLDFGLPFSVGYQF
jgi:hypothetical protein